MKMYRKIKQKYVLAKDFRLWFLLAVFCVFACSRSELYVSAPDSGETSVMFSLLLPSLNGTKAYRNNPNMDKDLEIETISILVFEGNDDSTGQFLYRFSDVEVTAENQFTIDLKLSGSAIRVHVFANAPAGSLADSYLGEIEKDALKNMEIKIDLNASSTYTIPMHGCIAFSTVVPGDINKDVNLLRSVAKVDVEVAQNDQTSTFELHGVAVYFTPNKGRLVSTSALTASGSNLSVSSPTMPITEYDILDKVETVPRGIVENVGEYSILNNLFIYENKLSIPINQDYTLVDGRLQGNSRIVVSGYYDGARVLSYYSVDFCKTDASGHKKLIPILRNHQYFLKITSVSGGGYEEEEEAANNIPADIVASIIDWTPVDENIIFDGVNYFYVKEKSFRLYGDVGIQGCLAVGSNINPEDWEMCWGSGGYYKKNKILTGSSFIVEKPTKNEGGFLKITTAKNFSPGISDVLHIRVTDQLKFTITVNQCDGSILTVDDKIGAFDVNIMDNGGRCKFKVLTGNVSVGWSASLDTDFTNMIYDSQDTGSDGDYLTVDIEPNPYDVPRSGRMTISRNGGGADDVILNFTQEAPINRSKLNGFAVRCVKTVPKWAIKSN